MRKRVWAEDRGGPKGLDGSTWRCCDQAMAVRTWRARLGGAAALSLVIGTAMSSLCFMPAAEGSGDEAHDCCKTGLSATPPSCCLVWRGADTQARLAHRVLVPALMPWLAGLIPPEAPAGLPARVECPRGPFSHSPPPPVLRI